SMDIRINFSITPDLSLQYWGQPFVYSADYSRFAEVVDAGNPSVNDQYHVFTDSEISYDEALNTYEVTEDGQSSFTFENPDFSVFEFRSNFVIRWEYIPGSTIFAVWSQGRGGDVPYGDFNFNVHIDNLVNVSPSNIFLLKFSYRISM
ncbi:MAG: hydrolase, partial [Bacteroidota bacterium]